MNKYKLQNGNIFEYSSFHNERIFLCSEYDWEFKRLQLIKNILFTDFPGLVNLQIIDRKFDKGIKFSHNNMIWLLSFLKKDHRVEINQIINLI
jgi:hypothetical protein